MKVRLVALHPLNYSSTETGANIRADMGQDVFTATVRFPDGAEPNGNVKFSERPLDKCPEPFRADLVERLRSHGHVREEVTYEQVAAAEKK